MYEWSFPGGKVVKNPPANAGSTRDMGSIPSWEDPLEKEMATHSSVLVWKTSWTEEFGRLQSMGSQSPWGHKELDITEQLSTDQHMYE